jgi:hypothetical protein
VVRPGAAEQPVIHARREYHLEIARSWYAYDAAVNSARDIRDRALDALEDQDNEAIWRAFDAATYEARIQFEKAIKDYRKKMNEAIRQNSLTKDK